MVNFLDRYFEDNCDYMPNSNVRHLTSSSRKVEVFQEFKEYMESSSQPICSKSFFRKIWNKRYSHVKIPKVRFFHEFRFQALERWQAETESFGSLTSQSNILFSYAFAFTPVHTEIADKEIPNFTGLLTVCIWGPYSIKLVG